MQYYLTGLLVSYRDMLNFQVYQRTLKVHLHLKIPGSVL